MRAEARTALLGQLLVVSLALAACDGPAGPAPLELEALARPPLDRVEETVRDQIRQAEAALDALSGEPAQDAASAWGELAMLYDAYGFPKAAATSYRNALLLEPSEPRWGYYLGRLARNDGRLEEAEEALRAAVEAGGDIVPVLAELGRVQLDQRQFDQATALSERILAARSDAPAGLLLRGQSALEQELWDVAIADYEQLLALQPGASRLRQPLAMAYRGRGDEEGARKQLARLGNGQLALDDPWTQELHDRRSGIHTLLDEALKSFQQGDFERTREALVKALEIEPESSRVHADLGSTLKELGQLAEAQAELEKAVTLEPSNAKAHYNLGVVLATQGNDSAAVASYDRAIASNPRYAEARFNRANARRRLGDPASALEDYAQLLVDDPGNSSAHLGRALTLIELGRDSAAMTALGESDQTFPQSPVFKGLIARLLATSDDAAVRDPVRALALAQALAAAAPTVEHFESLAMAQAANGEFAAAVATLDSVRSALLRATESGGGNAAVRALARVDRARAAYSAGLAPRDVHVD